MSELSSSYREAFAERRHGRRPHVAARRRALLLSGIFVAFVLVGWTLAISGR